MKPTAIKRKFKYNGMTLDDLGESLKPEAVRDLYADALYPELRTASVDGPVMEGADAVYTFVRASRDKG